jgi:hypothetical protein
MNSDEDVDNFIEHNTKRAQRRLKVLQRQSTPSHKAATTSQKKRKTPASAPAPSKCSAPTPKSLVAVASTPKAPAKSFQHSLAPVSTGSCGATSVGATEQEHDTQQQQQAEDAQGLSAAALAAACLASTSGQDPDCSAGPDSAMAGPSPVAQQNCYRDSEVQESSTLEAPAEAEAADYAAAETEATETDAPADAACPVCGSLLADMSSTEAGQAAHVNACLDAAAAAHKAEVLRNTVTHAAAVMATADECEQQQEQQQQELEVIDVADVEEDIATW